MATERRHFLVERAEEEVVEQRRDNGAVIAVHRSLRCLSACRRRLAVDAVDCFFRLVRRLLQDKSHICQHHSIQ